MSHQGTLHDTTFNLSYSLRRQLFRTSAAAQWVKNLTWVSTWVAAEVLFPSPAWLSGLKDLVLLHLWREFKPWQGVLTYIADVALGGKKTVNCFGVPIVGKKKKRQLFLDRKYLNQVLKKQMERTCHYKLQACPVHFLPQPLNQPFLQRALVPLFGEWY